VSDRLDQLVAARLLQHEPFNREQLLEAARAEVLCWSLGPKARSAVWSAAAPFLAGAIAAPGHTVQQWWEDLETGRWAVTATQPGRGVTWSAAAVRALIVGRFVTPSWALISTVQVEPWLRPLPATDPLAFAYERLRGSLAAVGWATAKGRRRGICTGMRLMLAHGYDDLAQLRDQDMEALPPGANGTDMLDVALCQLGVFARSPRRGTVRRKTEPAKTIEVLVTRKVPEAFREVTVLYMVAYAQRVSANYSTTRTKIRSLAYFWAYLAEVHPQVTSCRDVLPHHARGFAEWALVKARTLQRDTARKGTEDRTTTYDWMVDVRAFFTDLCTWGTEPGSPLADHAPRTVPLTSHDLNSGGFAAARARTTARMTASVMDLAREVPNIRAFALRRWHEATEHLNGNPDNHLAVRGERNAFWDWALLELLLTSGLRVEEASELTTLDVLKRQLPDGQIYYLLHIKPSKYDRARVIPVGDGLGRVIAEIIRHVKHFYATNVVPACDRRDPTAKTPLPRAPYLLQGAGHPSAMSIATIRGRLQALSVAAGAHHSDGTPMRLAPHDCRRMFATDALNSNTPVHVIAALLGHASLDTVMVYAKLYPDSLIEGYRTAMRGLYTDVYDTEATRTPTAQEWAAFAASCNLRDMGTHVCALPTGEHCARGLVCLGCNHAQPKKSAAPVFRQMITSHGRALAKAHEAGEPAGQIAARQLELERLRSALQRAEELNTDVADALGAV
jgi:integrase